MWLVLCDPHDHAALWAGSQLRSLGLMPVQFVAPQELLLASRLEYCAEVSTKAYAYAQLQGDRVIDTRSVHGTINRAVRLNCPQVGVAATQDRSYVQAEMDAIMLAWLAALSARAINPATASAWSGVQLSAFAWAQHAQAAGFTTLPYRCGHAGLEHPPALNCQLSTHLVFAEETYPALPSTLASAAIQLAKRVRVPLLGITLGWHTPNFGPKDARHANFIDANTLPDLRVGGTAFIAALAASLMAATPSRGRT